MRASATSKWTAFLESAQSGAFAGDVDRGGRGVEPAHPVSAVCEEYRVFARPATDVENLARDLTVGLEVADHRLGLADVPRHLVELEPGVLCGLGGLRVLVEGVEVAAIQRIEVGGTRWGGWLGRIRVHLLFLPDEADVESWVEAGVRARTVSMLHRCRV